MQASFILKSSTGYCSRRFFLLMCFGLVEIYSIALSQNNPDLLQFKKQLLFAGGGIIVMFLLIFVDYYSLRSFSIYLYVIGALLLAGVLVSENVQGNNRLVRIHGPDRAAG